MKKLSILLAVLLLVTMLAGCGATTGGTTTTTTAGGTAATTTVGNTDATTTVGDTDATTTVGDTDGTTVDTPVSTTVDTPVSTTVGNTDGTTVDTPVSTTVGNTDGTTVVTPNTTVVTPNTTVVTPVTTVKPTTVTTKVATTTTKTVTTPTQNGLTTPPNGNYNLAWQKYPGSVYLNMSSRFDTQADAMLATINGKADTLHASGTTYYISEKNGRDSNNGKSKSAAWKTVEPLRNASLKSGDVVLFERGGVYRVADSLKLVSGVSYGAYGSGTRPAIYGSARNYAGVGWLNQGGNVWKLSIALPDDVGVFVVNHGELYGQWVETRAELDKEMEFWCNRAASNVLYLYSTIDPNTFKSVEIGHDGRIFSFDGGSNITIENLTFKYTGGHAVRTSGSKNITVRGCEFGFIGGSVLADSSVTSSNVTRYGNACEFMGSSENTLIENCWFYQIYDSATTCQGSGTSKGFTLRNCLSEYVGMGTYEYWGVTHVNTTIEGNIMRFAGYGHGGNKGNNGSLRAHIQSNAKAGGSGGVLLQNFVVKNNVFDQSAYQLLNFCFSTNSTVTMSGNTYCQVKNNRRRPLGYFGSTTDTIYFDANVASTIKNVLKDATGVSAFA